MHKRAHKNEEAEFLHEGIRMLEKENQSLKNEIKNQQAVIEMLIKKWQICRQMENSEKQL